MRSENRTEILLSYTEPLVLEAYLLLNFVDFCHDSANHASMVALAAPKVLASCFLLPPEGLAVILALFGSRHSLPGNRAELSL